MPDVADIYLGVKIMLLRGDQMARDCVIAWKIDANENAMRRAHANPIDMRQYQVEFPGGKITALITNVIAKQFMPSVM